MGQEIPSSQAFLLTATLAGYYLSGLYGSLITYRIFLSPIRMFPGPFWAKISNVTFSAQLRKGDYPKDFKRSIKNTGILSVSDHQIFLLFIRRLLMPSTGVIPDVSKPTGTISPYRWYRCRPPVNAQNMTKGAAFGVEHFMVPCYAAMRVGLQSIRTSLSSTLKTSKGEKSILPIYSSCIALMLWAMLHLELPSRFCRTTNNIGLLSCCTEVWCRSASCFQHGFLEFYLQSLAPREIGSRSRITVVRGWKKEWMWENRHSTISLIQNADFSHN